MIDLTENIATNNIEEYYNLLNDESVELSISAKPLRNSRPGTIVSVMQLINTYIRRSGKKTIILDIRSNQLESLLKDLHQKPLVISTLLMLSNEDDKAYYNKAKSLEFKLNNTLIDSYKELERTFDKKTLYIYQKRLEKSQDKTERKELLRKIKAFRKKIDLYDNVSLGKETALLLSCFDHNIRLKFPLFFYDEHFNLTETSELSRLISFIFNKSNLHPTSELYNRGVNHDLSKIIYELIDNTHKHARFIFDKPGKMYEPNMRGAFIKLYEQGNSIDRNDVDTIEAFISNLTVTEILQRSLIQTTIENTIINKITICELSVIDSGPGLAQRISGLPLDALTSSQEVELTTNCFKKYVTSDQSSINEYRGYGLTSVIEKIGNKGFIRVRTGRICMERDFYSYPLNHEKEILNKDFKFFAIKEGLEKCSGTLITILYPFLN